MRGWLFSPSAIVQVTDSSPPRPNMQVSNAIICVVIVLCSACSKTSTSIDTNIKAETFNPSTHLSQMGVASADFNFEFSSTDLAQYNCAVSVTQKLGVGITISNTANSSSALVERKISFVKPLFASAAELDELVENFSKCNKNYSAKFNWSVAVKK